MHENTKWVELYNSIEKRLLDEVLTSKVKALNNNPVWLKHLRIPKNEKTILGLIRRESIKPLESRMPILLQNEISNNGKKTYSNFLLQLNNYFAERNKHNEDKKDPESLELFVDVTLPELRNWYRQRYDHDDPNQITFENDYEFLFNATETEIMKRLIQYEVAHRIAQNIYDVELGFRKPDKSDDQVIENIEPQSNTKLGSVGSIIPFLGQQGQKQQELDIPEEMKAILKVPEHSALISNYLLSQKWVISKNQKIELNDIPNSKKYVTDIIWKLDQLKCFNIQNDEELCDAFKMLIDGFSVSDRSLRGSNRKGIQNESREWCKTVDYHIFIYKIKESLQELEVS